jgi:hypothetical protein
LDEDLQIWKLASSLIDTQINCAPSPHLMFGSHTFSKPPPCQPHHKLPLRIMETACGQAAFIRNSPCPESLSRHRTRSPNRAGLPSQAHGMGAVARMDWCCIPQSIGNGHNMNVNRLLCDACLRKPPEGVEYYSEPTHAALARATCLQCREMVTIALNLP